MQWLSEVCKDGQVNAVNLNELTGSAKPADLHQEYIKVGFCPEVISIHLLTWAYLCDLETLFKVLCFSRDNLCTIDMCIFCTGRGASLSSQGVNRCAEDAWWLGSYTWEGCGFLETEIHSVSSSQAIWAEFCIELRDSWLEKNLWFSELSQDSLYCFGVGLLLLHFHKHICRLMTTGLTFMVHWKIYQDITLNMKLSFQWHIKFQECNWR